MMSLSTCCQTHFQTCHPARVVLAVILFTIPGIASADEPGMVRLESFGVEELWTAVNSRIEKTEVDGEPALRWFLEPGKSADLAMKPEHPIFGRLRSFSRLEFDFRVVSGQLDSMELRAQGHVSGPRQYKVHQWGLAVLTTERGEWHSRQVDLARPNWLAWDDPDGKPPHFVFGALAVEPGTTLELRRVRLMSAPLAIKPFFEPPVTWPARKDEADGSVAYTFKVPVLNVSGRPAVIRAELGSQHEKFQTSIAPPAQAAKNGQTVEFNVTARISKENIAATPELYSEIQRIGFSAEDQPGCVSTFEMPVTRPLSPGIKRQFVIPGTQLDFLREKIAAGDPAVRKALNVDDILSEAGRFLDIPLIQIPTSRNHPANVWPKVPGSSPPRNYELGAFMPEIVDPVTGRREAGTEVADAVWKEYLGQSGQAVEKLGLAYALTGDERYAAKAVELMELYAAQYGRLDLKSGFEPPWSDGPALLCSARTAAGSTYGSNWIFRLHMRMLSLVSESSAFTPEARSSIYEGFVLPYATEIAKFPGGISNMTDITNANLLVLGLVFDDANLVRWALHTDAGLISRLRDITGDGFSSEGRPPNYHLAAMDEYLPALGYLRNSGLKVELPKEKLLAAIRMPYQRATLWGVIPNTGDCGRGGFQVANSAHADNLSALFPDESWLVDIGLGSGIPAKARSLNSGRLPQKEGYTQLLETAPRLFRDAGLAILRSGSSPETQIMATLDYGRNPMHAHLDRNQITLAAFGKIFTHGPGTLYNAGSGGIIRTTDAKLDSFCGPGSLGQNVVMVDGMNQRPAIGKLLAWSDNPANQYAVSQVDGIAPGVSHTRSLILRDGLVIVLDRLESESEHIYDFVYHNFGDLSPGKGWEAAAVNEPLAQTANYQNIAGLAKLSGEGPVRLDWNLTDQVPPSAKTSESRPPVKLALWQLPIEGSEVFTGITGMNNPNTTRVPDAAPTLFTRVRGKTASFVTVLEPYREKGTVTGIEGDEERLLIRRGAETLEILPGSLAENSR